VQFSSHLALFRGGVAARAASGWLDRFESNGGGFGMVRRVVAAIAWHMTGKEKPALGGLIWAGVMLSDHRVIFCGQRGGRGSGSFDGRCVKRCAGILVRVRSH